MKTKQEKAFVLLEAMEQVDESMVRHAMQVDNPEKFMALERRTAFNRWGTIAACLALVLVLTAFPWLLSKLPAFTAPTEPSLPPTTDFTGPYISTEPPKLLAFNGSNSLWPHMTSYDWYSNHDLWGTVDISSPWINPLSTELQDKIPWITTEESTLQLKFELNRDSIHVRCWPAESFGKPDAYDASETVTCIDNGITLKTGRYIYEVTAQWYPSYEGEGIVTYVFGVECDFVIIPVDMDIQFLSGDMALSSIASGLKSGLRYDDVAGKWVDMAGTGGWWIMYDSVMNGTPLPTLVLSQDLQINLGPNGTLDNISVYYKNTETSPGCYMWTQDPAELSTLPVGKWHIIVEVTWQGRYIAQDAKYETYKYEHVLILDVPGPDVPAFLWDFDEVSGTLTVSGCEVIPDFTYRDRWTTPPWEGHRDEIKRVVIAEGITRIGNYAFYDLPNLQTVTLPDGLKEIGDHAFKGAKNLTQIRFPASLEKIGDYSFYNCGKLPEINLPEGLKSIGEGAFAYCVLPESLTIPESVTTVGMYAFLGCNGLKEVTILCTVQSLRYTFNECEVLQIIRFCGGPPELLEEITRARDEAIMCFYPAHDTAWTDEILDTANLANTVWFASEDPLAEKLPIDTTSGYCGRTAHWELVDGVLTISGTGDVSYIGWENYTDQIREVIIQDGITSIMDGSFWQSGNLTSVTIPQSVTYIGFRAFYECKKLKSVTIPENLEFMGDYAFWGCESITKITIPESLTTIPRGAFLRCTALEEVIFSGNLVEVGAMAFQNCTAIQTIHFPATLQVLGDSAFAGCTSLRKIYFYGDVPTVSNFTFEKVTATAYYPPDNPGWISGGLRFHSGDIEEKPDPNQSNQG